MITKITDEKVKEFLQSVEQGKAGFALAGKEDIFQELIARFRRREAGVDQELFPKIWPTMCEHFGGLRPEDLMILTGDSGRGKTTFFLRYTLSLLSQGHAAFMACLEGGFSQFCKRIGEMVLEKSEASWTMADIGAFKECSSGFGELYVYRPGGMADQDRILNAMRYAVLKHDVKFCVIDHLGFIKLDLRMGRSEAGAIGDFLKRVKAFNDKYRTPVLMVAHPAKTGDKGYREREIGMDELKGSSDIKQLADTVMSLFPNGDSDTPVTCLRFQKIRCSDYAKNTGLGVTFEYDHNRSALIENCTHPRRFK